jgi:DNA-binding NarL/FixJ family response regulator
VALSILIVDDHDGFRALARAMLQAGGFEVVGEAADGEAAGHSNGAICARLYLSPKTVETHVRQIFLKLGLREAPEYHRRVVAVLRFLRAAPPS